VVALSFDTSASLEKQISLVALKPESGSIYVLRGVKNGVIPRFPEGIPSGDAGSPIVIKAGDAGSGSGMTVLRVTYLNKRPF